MTQLTIRPIAAGEEAAVIALWHACGLTRPWNDPAQDLAFARGKSNSDVLVGLADNRIVASAIGEPAPAALGPYPAMLYSATQQPTLAPPPREVGCKSHAVPPL